MPPQATNTRDRTFSPEIPPPAISLSTTVALQPLPFRETMCCTATATYEPARPGAVQRLIHKVPKGLAPPRPLHDIEFSLPPDASPALMQKKRMDLKASVDASGRVTRVELLFPKDERLVELAADAANRWKFAPAQLNGQPVPGELILHFSFEASPGVQIVMDKSKSR
jgi:protein TonB